MATVIEKRKERRIKVNLAIKMVYQDNLVVVGKTENISLLGAYLELNRQIPQGTDLDISVEIPIYTEDLSLTGELRCKGNLFRCDLIREIGSKKYYGIGIFFTSFLSQVDRDKLSKYIDFLILQGDKSIKEGIKRWKDKRDIIKKIKQTQQELLSQRDYQKETISLLKQILSRLEEISHLLKLQSQNKDD